MDSNISLDTIVDDVFSLIIEQLLDEEDPALVSVSNKHHVTMQQQFPGEFWNQIDDTELNNPPDNLFNERAENMADEPQNTASGLNRDSFGYHHVVKLRAVSKTVKQRIDKLPFISVRKDLDKFYSEHVAPKNERDFIMLGIKSEIHIAELQHKWPRILDDYLHRTAPTDNDKRKMIENNFTSLYNRAKHVYNERCEDHNGKVYGKASLLELEFIDVNNEPLTLQVKLVHCWDVRESNWYTEIFIYALNKDRQVAIRPNMPSNNRRNNPAPPPPKNCLMQLWKDRGWLDMTYYNDELVKTVCMELSIDTSFWAANTNSCLLLEFLLLAAGESKFTHFIPIAKEKQHGTPQSYDWQLVFESDREPENKDQSFLTTVKEFKDKFLGNKVPSGKPGQRYLLNAKVQLGASDVEWSLKTSSEPLAKYIESISHCYDLEVAPGEFGHINSFYMKAIMKTHDGGSFVLWLVEKIGHGYHSPCDYITLQVMPMNAISARALGLEIYQQGVVYYHFFAKQVVVNKQLSEKLIDLLSAVFASPDAEASDDEEQPTGTKKRKAPQIKKPQAKKRRTGNGAVDAEEQKPVTFLTLFDTLLKVRFCVMRRMGGFSCLDSSYFTGDDTPGFSHESIGTDWGYRESRRITQLSF